MKIPFSINKEERMYRKHNNVPLILELFSCLSLVMVYTCLKSLIWINSSSGESVATTPADVFDTQMNMSDILVCNESQPLEAGGSCQCNGSGSEATGGVICRGMRNDCDLPEFCSNSLKCPRDVKLTNGTQCADGGGLCVSGECIKLGGICGTSNDSGNSSVFQETICTSLQVCLSGSCIPIDWIPSPGCPRAGSGGICSRNGFCADESQCICICGWRGDACQSISVVNSSEARDANCISSSYAKLLLRPTTQATPKEDVRWKTTLSAKGEKIDPNSQATVVANAIVGGVIAIAFALAVFFGATSIGFKNSTKENRMRALHRFRIVGLFTPSQQQQRNLMRRTMGGYHGGHTGNHCAGPRWDNYGSHGSHKSGGHSRNILEETIV